MDNGVRLFLHPRHSEHGSTPRPLVIDRFSLATDAVAHRLQTLQHVVEDAAKTTQHLDESSTLINVDCGPFGLSIGGPSPVPLSPFFGQFAQITLSPPLCHPHVAACGGMIVGIIACGCPSSADLAFPHLQHHRHGEEEEGAMWLLLAVSSVDATTSMRKTGDVLASIGYIRNDFDKCFDLEGELGEGSFAKVHIARRKAGLTAHADSEQFAAKAMKPTATAELVALEASFLVAAQSHPHIVKFAGLFCTVQGWTMVMERCSSGDLKDYVCANKNFDEVEGIDIVGKSLFSALSHIHARGILHRDIKPENLLLDHQPGDPMSYRAVLADFGIACHMSEHEKMKKRCGTPGCVAPEMLVKNRMSPKCDVFSGGCTLYFALGARMPFRGPDLMTTLRCNALAEVDFDGAVFKDSSDDTKHTLKLLLRQKPNGRPTALQATALLADLTGKLLESTMPALKPPSAPVFMDPLTPVVPAGARPKLQSRRALSEAARLMRNAEKTAPPPQGLPPLMAGSARLWVHQGCGANHDTLSSVSTASGSVTRGSVLGGIPDNGTSFGDDTTESGPLSIAGSSQQTPHSISLFGKLRRFTQRATAAPAT
jgi:calcium/calmodulin-dependent protein kinase I